MDKINPVALRKLLAEHFSLDELRVLCFDLGENMERFAGPAVLKDTLRDLGYLRSAGWRGLEPAIQLLENPISNPQSLIPNP